MKLLYDAEVDALSIIFRDATVTTRELAEGITAEYDGDGRLAGLEVLEARKRFGDDETFRDVLVEGIGLSAAVLREKPEKPYGT